MTYNVSGGASNLAQPPYIKWLYVCVTVCDCVCSRGVPVT